MTPIPITSLRALCPRCNLTFVYGSTLDFKAAMQAHPTCPHCKRDDGIHGLFNFPTNTIHPIPGARVPSPAGSK